MKTGIRGQVSGVSLLLGILASPLVGQTSLSIYSDGRVVVRKTLPQKLQRGSNIFSLDLPGLDPATLFSPDSNVAVTSAVLRPATDMESALRASIGRTLTFVQGKGDTIQATILSVNPPQTRLANGQIMFSLPGGTPLFPAEASLVRSKPEALVTLEAGRARDVTDLAYVSQGVTWEAVYQAVLSGSGTALVTGAATINSSSMKVDSVSVQLVAGSVNRARSPAAPMMAAGMMAARDELQKAAGYAGEQTVGETHVYELPGPISFDIGAPLTTALFPRARADYTQEFVVPGVLPWRGYFGPIGQDPNTVPVQVWYTFKRPHGSGLGDRPLPGGTMEVFQRDSSGRVQLVGEASFTHTPAGKDLRVESGEAFDVTAERIKTDYHQVNVPNASGRGTHNRVTASYKVTLTNAKNQVVTVDVRESHWGSWVITDSNIPAEKLTSSEQRFRVPVPANGTATLTYTVQVDS
ncbi:MAG TPA: hypothetical protein VH163_00100 [Gemmatimonadales bacterium]|nr:hypothetical protein [Gemmatimonadales bacterium]